MLMASDVAHQLIHYITEYGDMPCVLEHHSVEKDGVLLDPLKDVVLMTIHQSGGDHTEACIWFTERSIEDENIVGQFDLG